MQQFIRKGYTGAVVVGPFLNQADGKTPLAYGGVTWTSVTGTRYKGTTVTSLTVSGTTVTNTTTTADRGYYYFTDATCWDTTGTVILTFASPSQHLFVRNEFVVLEAALYDWLFGTTLYVDNTNTLLKAALDKAATTPSGVGTYTPSTDSLEALRDRFDASVAPNTVGGAALSGSGYLADSVAMIRQMVEEAVVNAKYTDGDILTYLRGASATVLADMNVNTDHPVVVRYNVTIEVDKQTYTLPPKCHKVYALAKINSTTGTKEWEVYPGSRWDFSGYGFMLEGNTIRLLSKWKSGHTLECAFVPNGEPHPHKASSATYAAGTFTLPSTVTDGTLDTRPNCYAGYLLRVLASTDVAAVYSQERIISSYNNQTRVATLSENFSPALVGTVTYEVVPMYSELTKQVFAMKTALMLLSFEGSSKKYGLLEDVYQKALRALRLTLRKEARMGQAFEGRTPDNPVGNPWPYGFSVL